ncbi:hypothetical protein EUGRSUZ_F01525 [Eucalyptus grandis]|uniref:Uncharacterized protein n=2 Tax=Eucalyptus grandis TaxID=71139 RepID=A0ACC3KFJ2_EUCGR|nr:hypothetical protein EUGRSUZ_F01525 [Eucalyptus grandis]
MIVSPRKRPNTRALGNKLTSVIIVFIVLDILKQAVSPQGERSQLRIHQITERSIGHCINKGSKEER